MTENKPIMIDGEDVSECTHYSGGECLIDYYLLYGYEISHYSYCRDCKDCYFKQLARKTQECEEKDKGIKYLTKCLDNSFKTQEDSEFYWEKERKKLKADNEELSKNSIGFAKKCQKLELEVFHLKDKNNVLTRQLDQLKAEKEQIKKYLGISSKTIMERLEELQEFRDRDRDKLYQAEQKLERIEVYCKEQNLKADYTACGILQIIDEVE